MSKRFGRNQRRKARLEIAQLRQAVATESRLVAQYARRRSAAEAEIEQAKRILAENTALFEPQFLRLLQQRDGLELPGRFDLDRISVASIDDPSPYTYSVQRYSLPFLLAGTRRGALDDCLHCYVEFQDKTWAYAVTDETIRMTPADVLAERISTIVSRAVARELKAHIG